MSFTTLLLTRDARARDAPRAPLVVGINVPRQTADQTRKIRPTTPAAIPISIGPNFGALQWAGMTMM